MGHLPPISLSFSMANISYSTLKVICVRDLGVPLGTKVASPVHCSKTITFIFHHPFSKLCKTAFTPLYWLIVWSHLELLLLLRWAPRALEGGPSERQHLLGVSREDSERGEGRRTTKGGLAGGHWDSGISVANALVLAAPPCTADT